MGFHDVEFFRSKFSRLLKNRIRNNDFSDINIYDITEDEYTLYLYGKSDDGEILFESSLDVGLIEPGSFGKNALKNKIFLKEK